MSKEKKTKKTKVLQTKQVPTAELKVVAFRWMSRCEPKDGSEEHE